MAKPNKEIISLMYLQFKDFNYPIELELVTVDNEQLTLEYFSLIEQRLYILHTSINTTSNLTIGIAPYGGVAIWHTKKLKSSLVQWLKANPLQNKEYESCIPPIKSLPYNLFDNYMTQFIYRYGILFESKDTDNLKWGKTKKFTPELDYIEEALYDGTHDKLHDGGLIKYHQAGKPKKLRIQWHIKKSEYTAYFWFEDERIREVFDKFYGAHPDTKTDFIIRIDAEKRKYELALYRYGLKEPQIIPEDVYQLLVFKNRFEDYRSENYNQERGAWIW